ncbi:MAG: CFI-box-CTERM domain-containing protein [Bdellovibrionales bacterium]
MFIYSRKRDEKVFLSSVNVATSFPALLGDIVIEKIRVMFSPTSFDDTGPDINFVDIDVVNTDEIGDDVVDGLDNDTIYAFSFASIDNAGNVAYFQADSLFDSACAGAGITTTSAISGLSSAQVAACPYLGQPGEIVGLIKDDMNCFIATAAYGTHMHKHLNVLRAFRNKFLLTNSYGKKFVNFYYDWGAKFSFLVRDSKWIRYASLLVLWPTIGFAKLSLQLGLVQSILLTLLAFISMITCWMHRRKIFGVH